VAKNCGIRPPLYPLVLALEKDYKAANKSKLKLCCSSCSVDQRCTKSDKVYHTTAQELDLFKHPPRRQEEDESSEETPSKTPIAPNSSISSRTRKQ
ncbi:hypothetical protein Nmel_000223, partial [Mimus melanotis]